MVNQFERDFWRRFSGDSAFYLGEEKSRQRLFLQRNVRKVLEQHRKLQRRHRRKSTPSQQALNELRAASHSEEHDTRPVNGKQPWSFSRDLLEERHAILKADITGITKIYEDGDPMLWGSGKFISASKNQTSDLRCLVRLKICERDLKHDPLSTRQPLIHLGKQQATIQRVDTGQGPPSCRIVLDQPFMIEVEEMLVRVHRGAAWKLSVPDQCEMRIMLSLTDSKDSELWPPFPVHTTDAKALGKRDRLELTASWLNLPACPPRKQQLNLESLQSGHKRTYATDCALDVDIGWSKNKTPLEAWNEKMRESPADRFPTPISEPDVATSKVKTKYLLGDWCARDSEQTKTLILAGYLCPFCRGRDFGNFEFLSFHFKTCHDLLKFDVKRKERGQQSDRVTKLEISVDLSENQSDRRRTRKVENKVIAWVRPRVNFNLSNYLEGDESWVGGSVGRAPSRNRTRRLSRHVQQPDPDLRTEANLVQDIPPPQRTRYRVPSALTPNVTFFRNTSKRPLIEGELVSESDDDVDEDWLMHKHNEVIDDFTDIPKEEKQFIKRWDAYILDEDLSGTVYLPDAMIRFVRKNKDFLAQTDMLVEFAKITASLKIQGLLNDRLISQCMMMIHANEDGQKNIRFGAEDEDLGREEESPLAKRQTRLAGSARNRRDIASSTDGDTDKDEERLGPRGESSRQSLPKRLNRTAYSRPSESQPRVAKKDVMQDQSSPEQHETEGPIYGRCVCGSDIQDLSKMIICANF
ncbi:MAG: hypothetical protein M1819_005189, partial [Sarea resinae]